MVQTQKYSASQKHLLIPSVLSISLVSACGALNGSGGSAGDEGKNATLKTLIQDGLPAWETITLGVPAEVWKLPGFAAESDGLPSKPKSFSKTNLFGSLLPNEFGEIIDEAQSLSIQGLAEASRLQTIQTNLLKPLYNLVSQSQLFSSVNTPSNPIDTAALFIPKMKSLQSSNFFASLLQSTSFSVALPETPGFPSHFVLSAPNQIVRIEALWKQGAQFRTGALFEFASAAKGDLSLQASLFAKSVGGLIKGWRKQNCDDDIYSIAFSTGKNQNSFALSSWECPQAQNTMSTISFTKGSNNTLKITGAMAQNFDVNGQSSLRASLGTRQGVLFSANASTTGPFEMALAGAVLGEKDFTKSNAEILQNFGVAQVVSRYAGAKVVSKKEDSSSAAYYMCKSFAGIGLSQSFTSIDALCKGGDEVDTESAITQLKSSADWTNDNLVLPLRFAGVDASAVATTLQTAASVFSIRNTIFVSGGKVAYKMAPSETAKKLESDNLGLVSATASDSIGGSPTPVNLSSLKSVSKETLARFRTLNEVPKVEFNGDAAGIGGFLNKACGELASQTAALAGKTADAKKSCL